MNEFAKADGLAAGAHQAAQSGQNLVDCRHPMLRGNLKYPRIEAREHEASVTLVDGDGVRVERIVSHGQVSPPGFWYDQDEHEYVVILEGSAELEVEGVGLVRLGPGDWVDLPAHLRHRVAWTDPTTATVWLAVFRTPKP